MLSAELRIYIRKISTTFNPILEVTISFSSVKILLPKSYLRAVAYGIRSPCLLDFICFICFICVSPLKMKGEEIQEETVQEAMVSSTYKMAQDMVELKHMQK
jgi:hypothetical protein